MNDLLTQNDAVALLADRINHLEGLLVSNLVGFLLTGAFTGFAAFRALSPDGSRAILPGSERPIAEPRQLFLALNLLFAFISGYYYFLLAQFYAAFVALVPLTGGLRSSFQQLWSVLHTPSFLFLPRFTTNVLMLLTAPLFPFVFSVSVLVGFWLLLRRQKEPPAIGALILVASIVFHSFLWFTLISQPFNEFIGAIRT